MRIQSKFQDYYDSCQYSLGEDVFYDRNMNLRTNSNVDGPKYIKDCSEIFKKYIPKESKNFDWKNKEVISELFFNIILIGDKMIPYCTLYYGDYYHYMIGKNIEYKNLFYQQDSNDIVEMKSSRRIRDFENHLSKDYTSLSCKIREITKEPIISFSSYHNYYSNISDLIKMQRGTMLNPSLKELGLSKIIEPHIVIQELELFIKKHRNIEKEVQFSNELKIQNAGFDKNSFRF